MKRFNKKLRHLLCTVWYTCFFLYLPWLEWKEEHFLNIIYFNHHFLYRSIETMGLAICYINAFNMPPLFLSIHPTWKSHLLLYKICASHISRYECLIALYVGFLICYHLPNTPNIAYLYTIIPQFRVDKMSCI